MEECRGAAFMRVSQNALSTTEEIVAASEPFRRSIMIQNLDTSITVWWGFDSTVSSSTGGRLLAGESVTLPTTAAIWMEAASGTPTVSITKFLDVLT